jgi:hypothetical protein
MVSLMSRNSNPKVDRKRQVINRLKDKMKNLFRAKQFGLKVKSKRRERMGLKKHQTRERKEDKRTHFAMTRTWTLITVKGKQTTILALRSKNS